MQHAGPAKLSTVWKKMVVEHFTLQYFTNLTQLIGTWNAIFLAIFIPVLTTLCISAWFEVFCAFL